jgi:carbonic anhydrase
MILIILFSLIKTLQCINNTEWNYDTYGPSYWNANYPSTCGHGHKQSPINIVIPLTEYDSSLKDIEFNNYHKILNWNVTNNGHTSIYNLLRLTIYVL